MRDQAKRSDTRLVKGYVALIGVFYLGFAILHYIETRETILGEVSRQAEGVVRWLDRNLAFSRQALQVVAEQSETTCAGEEVGRKLDAMLRSVAVEQVEIGRGSQTLCSWTAQPAQITQSQSACHAEAGRSGVVQISTKGPGDLWAKATLDTACLVSPLIVSLEGSAGSIRVIHRGLTGAATPGQEKGQASGQASGQDQGAGGGQQSEKALLHDTVLAVPSGEGPLALQVAVSEWSIARSWAGQIVVFGALFAAFGAMGWYGPLAHLRNRLSVEGQVQSALRRGDFSLVYLPTVDIATGEWIGVEALLRWNHPTHGQLQPASFIPWIEKSPLIYETTRWVMRRAAADLGRFRHVKNGLDVSINVPPSQLGDPRMVSMATEAFGDTPQSLRCVIIELTEREITDYSSDVVQGVVSALRERGAQFALDDFGVGFSNFACLHYIKVDYIKVDKSFLQESEGRSFEASAMGSIVHLARQFGVSVIAEGVETERQVQRLKHYGIDKAQGFLFSRPVDADTVLDKLNDRKALEPA